MEASTKFSSLNNPLSQYSPSAMLSLVHNNHTSPSGYRGVEREKKGGEMREWKSGMR